MVIEAGCLDCSWGEPKQILPTRERFAGSPQQSVTTPFPSCPFSVNRLTEAYRRHKVNGNLKRTNNQDPDRRLEGGKIKVKTAPSTL